MQGVKNSPHSPFDAEFEISTEIPEITPTENGEDISKGDWNDIFCESLIVEPPAN
jgi:hypothetical protein